MSVAIEMNNSWAWGHEDELSLCNYGNPDTLDSDSSSYQEHFYTVWASGVDTVCRSMEMKRSHYMIRWISEQRGVLLTNHSDICLRESVKTVRYILTPCLLHLAEQSWTPSTLMFWHCLFMHIYTHRERERHTQRDTHTHARRDTHTQRHTQRHTNTHARRDTHAETHTHTETHTQTHTHRDTHTHTHTHRDTHTETHTHTQTHTQRRTHTETHTHRDTHTQRHTHRDTHRHTHTQRRTHTETHTHRDTHTSVSDDWQLNSTQTSWHDPSKQGGKVSHSVHVLHAIQFHSHALLYNFILLILWCQGYFQLCQDVTSEDIHSFVNKADFIHDSTLTKHAVITFCFRMAPMTSIDFDL